MWRRLYFCVFVPSTNASLVLFMFFSTVLVHGNLVRFSWQLLQLLKLVSLFSLLFVKFGWFSDGYWGWSWEGKGNGGKMKWVLLNLMFSDDQQNIFMKEFRWKAMRIERKYIMSDILSIKLIFRSLIWVISMDMMLSMMKWIQRSRSLCDFGRKCKITSDSIRHAGCWQCSLVLSLCDTSRQSRR
jgi:hypothetical protein